MARFCSPKRMASCAYPPTVVRRSSSSGLGLAKCLKGHSCCLIRTPCSLVSRQASVRRSGTKRTSLFRRLALVSGKSSGAAEVALDTYRVVHLIYLNGNTLFAAAFDPNASEMNGQPIPVVEGVMRPTALAGPGVDSSAAQYAVAESGTLVYVAGVGPQFGGLLWVGRSGNAEQITTIPIGEYPILRLSPDHQSVLTYVKNDVWTYDIATGRGTRITRDGLATGPMAWHPSGKWVAYTSSGGGGRGSENVWMVPSDGSEGAARQLTKLAGTVDVDYWSPDGRVLAVHHHRTDGGISILTIRTDTEEADTQTFIDDEAGAEGTTFSPDGRYVAYMANDTGQREVYVRSYPGAGGRTTVSVGGGREPIWGRNGELFYRSLRGDRMMAVAITTEPSLQIGKPQEVFTRQYAFNSGGSPRALYDVVHDGQRFLMLGAAGQTGQEQIGNRFIVVQNWFEELKRLVPTN